MLIDHAILARYAAPGYLVYVTAARSAMAVPFDISARKITGTPGASCGGPRPEMNALDVAVSQTGMCCCTSPGAKLPPVAIS
jgi:hypothetical protein